MAGMDIEYDSNSEAVTRIRARFGRMRSLTLNAWNNQLYLHLNDNSKCFDDSGYFDKTKSKSVSMKWEEAVNLKHLIHDMAQYVDKFDLNQVSFFSLYITAMREETLSYH